MDGADPTRSRVTALNDLISRLTLLAASGGYTLSARLLEGPGGASLELRASRSDAGRTQEYSRLLRLSDLDSIGPEAIAKEFAREARGVLMKPISSGVSGAAFEGPRKAHS
jgi:hypothetical protein